MGASCPRYTVQGEENFMNQLKKGDIIKTSLGDNTMVLDVKDSQAILFTGNQFVLASGIKKNKKDEKFEWDSGKYVDDLKSISLFQNDNFDSMKESLSFLAEYNHRDFVKSVIALESGIQNEEVLDNIYETYMETDDMELINVDLLKKPNSIETDLKEDESVKNDNLSLNKFFNEDVGMKL